MAQTDFSPTDGTYSIKLDRTGLPLTTTEQTLVIRQDYPFPPKELPPEIKEILDEHRKRVYALKLLLEKEENVLKVYERMLSG